jgi:hypothetical protein
VQNWGFGISGSGFRVSGSGFWVPDFKFRDSGSGVRVSRSGFRISGVGFRVQDVGFRVQGVEFRVQDVGFMTACGPSGRSRDRDSVERNPDETGRDEMRGRRGWEQRGVTACRSGSRVRGALGDVESDAARPDDCNLR